MARFLSFLMLLAGLAAAGFGAFTLLSPSGAGGEMASSPMMDTAATAPVESPAQDSAPAPDEPNAPPAPASAPEPQTEPAPAPADKEILSGAMEEIGIITSEPAPGTFDTGDARVSEPVPVTAGVSSQDAFLEKLQTVPVAHETPATAEYKRAFDVTFAIDATGDATAADALPGRGVVETGEARVTERVFVKLSGAAFKIEDSSPPTQVLSPVTENVWRWKATPMTAGTHDLTFEVFAIDQDDVTPLRTYNDTVTVKVSGVSAAVAFADRVNPLFVLLGGLGSALAGAFGVARFFRKT